MSDHNLHKTETHPHHTPRRAYLAIWILLGSLSLLTALCLLLFEAGMKKLTATPDGSPDYARHYAFIGDSSSVFVREVFDAAQKEGALSGDYVSLMGEGLDIRYSELQLLDIAAASRVDGIIVSANAGEEMLQAINEVEQAGIPVVCVGTDSYGSLRQSYVGISYYTLGQEYGEVIASLATDAVQKVTILTSPNEKNRGQNLVYSGIVDYIGKAGLSSRFSFETMAAGNGTMFSAAESITDLFNSSDLPQILVCLDETNTTCACQSIVDTNQVGDVTILGYYVNDTIKNAVEKQIIPATLTVNAGEIGRSSIRCLDEYLENGFVTEYIPIDIDTLTADNIDAYMEQRSAAENASASQGKEVSG